LYIFGCTEDSCGSKPGSWKALRCQLSPPPPSPADVITDDDENSKRLPTPNQHLKQQHPLPIKKQPSNDWGLGDNGTDGNDAFDFSELDTALKSAHDKPSTVPHHHHHKSSNKASGNNTKAKNQSQLQQQQYPQPYAAKLRHSLPGFYLYADTEPTSSTTTITQHLQHHNQQPSNDKKNDNIDAHIRDLLTRYEAEEGPLSATLQNDSIIDNNDEDSIIIQGDALDKSATASSSGSNALKQQVEVWSGEKYEEDAVLGAEGRRAIAAAYLAFSKRLTRVPDQCARYWFNGTPLWPTTPIHRHTSGTSNNNNDIDNDNDDNDKEGGVCGVCGRERVFEMQLMSPVVAAIEEVAGWMEVDLVGSLPGEEKGKTKGVIPDGWEWVTIGVWACPQSCSSGGGCWVEEEVCICND
jgi:hypothetical protein